MKSFIFKQMSLVTEPDISRHVGVGLTARKALVRELAFGIAYHYAAQLISKRRRRYKIILYVAKPRAISIYTKPA